MHHDAWRALGPLAPGTFHTRSANGAKSKPDRPDVFRVISNKRIPLKRKFGRLHTAIQHPSCRERKEKEAGHKGKTAWSTAMSY
jgi:hypothetical protein